MIMNTNKNEFKKLLESKGIKPTVQRLEIMEYVSENKNHPTADQVYRELVKRIPVLSKTTVYNTLNKLAETGLLTPLAITGSEVRFDSLRDSHHHFLCDKCGAIIDLDIKCPHCEKEKIEGHLIKGIHGHFKGICKNCLRK